MFRHICAPHLICMRYASWQSSIELATNWWAHTTCVSSICRMVNLSWVLVLVRIALFFWHFVCSLILLLPIFSFRWLEIIKNRSLCTPWACKTEYIIIYNTHHKYILSKRARLHSKCDLLHSEMWSSIKFEANRVLVMHLKVSSSKFAWQTPYSENETAFNNLLNICLRYARSFIHSFGLYLCFSCSAFLFYQTYYLVNGKTESIEFNKSCPNKSNWALIRLLRKLIINMVYVCTVCTMIVCFSRLFGCKIFKTMAQTNSPNIMIVVASNMLKLPIEFADSIEFDSIECFM